MPIDPKAPVSAEHSVMAACSPGRLWDVLANVANWTAVYPEMKDIELAGDVAKGQTFTFRSGPGRITATFEEVEAPSVLAFEGTGMGATSAYRFELTPVFGGTRLAASQSMSGMAVRPMKKMLQGIATTSLTDLTEALARHATAAP